MKSSSDIHISLNAFLYDLQIARFRWKNATPLLLLLLLRDMPRLASRVEQPPTGLDFAYTINYLLEQARE